MTERATICVDLDGVLASWDHGTFGTIGPPIPGAAEFSHRLGEMGQVVIYTCRCTEELYRPLRAHLLANAVRDWLTEHGFHFDHIWIGQGKPVADVYIDDRAVSCRPEHDPLAFARVECKAAAMIGKKAESCQT